MAGGQQHILKYILVGINIDYDNFTYLSSNDFCDKSVRKNFQRLGIKCYIVDDDDINVKICWTQRQQFNYLQGRTVFMGYSFGGDPEDPVKTKNFHRWPFIFFYQLIDFANCMEIFQI